MFKYRVFLKKLSIFYLLILTSFFISGYGYMGKLPELGKKSESEKQTKIRIEKNTSEFKPPSIIVPRPNIRHKINKYSDYLEDIKEVYALLSEIRDILQGNHQDKTQLFCAKVTVLNLYIDTFKEKYGDKREKYYETYNQLIMLDKYLAEIVDYKKGIERYKIFNTGTLENKLQDEKHLEQKIEKAIIPINTVIGIIDETS